MPSSQRLAVVTRQCTPLFQALKSDALKQRRDRLLLHKRAEMAYNLALSKLHAGHHQRAFAELQALTRGRCYGYNPHVWLHLAEACIAADDKGEVDMKEMRRPGEGSEREDRPTFAVVGEGKHRKVS